MSQTVEITDEDIRYAENILLPFNESNEELIEIIDRMFRQNKSIDQVLIETNKHILGKNYNFTEREIEIAEGIRQKLMLRKLNKN